MSHEPRVFVIDPDEIDRYARAIARIADKGHLAGSTELERAVNTYGTAFQFLVMRRGAEYGRALGMAAGNHALTLCDARARAETLVSGEIGDIHERVCVAEEEALARDLEQAEGTEADG